MKLHWPILLIAVLGLTALCYANSLNGGWIFDDMAIRAWLGPGLPAEAAREFGISHRPLLWFTYWITSRYAGFDNTFWYHAGNLLIHLLSIAVVFGICRRLLKSAEAAAFGALLFGIHPFFTSAVDYIDGRGSLLCAFFVLLSCWLLIAFTSWRRWPLAALSLIAACAVKEEAAAFLVLGLGYGIVMNRKWLAASCLGLMTAGLAAIIWLVPYVPTVFTSKTTKPVASLILNGFDTLTRSQQIRAVASGFVIHNLGSLLWPMRLTADPAPILGWGYFAISVFILTILIAIILWRKLSHGLRLGAAALLASPMLGAAILMLADPTFEYRSYICGLGLALIAGSAFLWLNRWASPQFVASACIGIILFFGLLTTQRNEVWRSSLGIWAEAYHLAPTRVRPAQNYSADLIAVKRTPEAIALLEGVLKDRPTLRGVNANLALAYLQMGQSAQAEKYAEKGLPVFNSYLYLSLAQMGLDKREEAVISAQHAVDLEVKSPEAWGILAQAMARNGKNYESYLAQAHQRGLIQLGQIPMNP